MLYELIRAIGVGGKGRQKLERPFVHLGDNAWVAQLGIPGADGNTNPYGSAVCLYEDDVRLTSAHANLLAIRWGGEGRYQHSENGLQFSTTDGSDPNTNGRRYTFDTSLTLDEWERSRIERSTKRWMRHSAGAMFIARGGEIVPPPLTANLGLTNKCNLRCEICGSQKHLDNTGVRRRHMEFSKFQSVADTLFPLLSVVELNSQGDPLLHPQIERVLGTIESHKCDVKIQHNGTLLSGPIIDLLLRQHGTITLSLDAVGQKFDEVRQGGVWSKAIPGLERLLRERDPKRMTIGVYPTLTARTIGEAMNVAKWSADHDVDEIGFHRYVTTAGSFEETPSEEQYIAVRAELREWALKNNATQRIMFEGEMLREPDVATRRQEFADLAKAVAVYDSGKVIFPMEANQPGSDPFSSCAAPHEYVEIGLDGQIGTCCRAQDVVLGHATSPEAFADSWLGANYSRVRRSLRRGETGSYPLPNCEGCVKFFAPKEARNRCAVDYSKPAVRGEERLEFGLGDTVAIEGIQKDDGFCHVAVFPLGIQGEFELWEDNRKLYPSQSHHDDIRSEGLGQYHIGANSVYFSTSDGTDARRNGRSYSLRRKAPRKPGETLVIDGFQKEDGYCYIAVLPLGIPCDFELWEDDRRLGPASSYHVDIRTKGEGRYHVGDYSVYFSTSDGTDARRNGRSYSLRPVVVGAAASPMQPTSAAV